MLYITPVTHRKQLWTEEFAMYADVSMVVNKLMVNRTSFRNKDMCLILNMNSKETSMQILNKYVLHTIYYK